MVIVLFSHQSSNKEAVLIPVRQLGKLRHQKMVSPPEAISGAWIGKLVVDFGRQWVNLSPGYRRCSINWFTARMRNTNLPWIWRVQGGGFNWRDCLR